MTPLLDAGCQVGGVTSLDKFLPPHVKNRIAPVMLRPDVQDSYGRCWAMTANGDFSTKTTYNTLDDPIPAHPTNIWKRIWKLCVPQRLGIFIWVILHGKALTNEERYKKSFTIDPFYYCCTGQSEDLDHVFRSCPKAMMIWDHLDEAPTQHRHHQLVFEDWLY